MTLQFFAPTIRQFGNQALAEEPLEDLFLLKEEPGAVQVALTLDQKTWLTLNQNMALPWKGLDQLYRLSLDLPEGLEGRLSFEEAVLDDDGQYKKDRILHEEGRFLERGTHCFWVDLKGLAAGTYHLGVTLSLRQGFEDERVLLSAQLPVEVSDFAYPKEEAFFLDLWQHLSALARYYAVPLWSDDHFNLIANYMKPLAEAGQKVCDLVISDYAWAGQACYQVPDNPSSLFEYNIVGLSRQAGELKADFTAMDRYLDLCLDYGMADEINLFGILGNWDAYSFGSPLEDYEDPIRVRVYDEETGLSSYLRTKADLATYLSLVFDHLQERGLWDRVKVISDEPNDPERFRGFEDFLSSCSKEAIDFKHACLHSEFLEAYEGDFESNSVISSILIDKMDDSHSKVWSRRHQMTWYSCCFPQNLNVFVRSPLMESRLVGYLTYAFGTKGFLRWNYCLWTEDPDKDITYKTYKWAAGDMFFVYPGANGRPEYSLRWKQLVFGLQDYRFFKAIAREVGEDKVQAQVQRLTGDIRQMTYDAASDRIDAQYIDDFNLLQTIKRDCLALLEMK
ncbi:MULTISPECIES: DUF4091 domain-containing protein [Aerococcus]|uniref:DUF4091 domain-containing protein n=1 Tax=Aerococcus sanguinicola TaxID=119206 RepID=A0A5N1GKG7_9LACT|nr:MULTISPECIES: DUF4091 domain-containing protein [Aerococcus]KAA9301302.1 DUF4091 domain-containing protein [Aerococcus sanguinicola]MDK6370061.1 DUF4091 domain-containing protein [Aerococcus sp. UMB9870]MDK6680673.1 DUF4091 domain-containing protein [Aerococcus sp. UMB8608]MDK6687460.1 DUF4091 domain-containing protein [Aerococcus sp. UMB8623]MDK6940623.1 DUF4091 domain-containing protein [Aerococcus sp. UMB8487]